MKKKREPEPIPPLPENWDRCQAFINRKRRYCRQTICPTVPGLLVGKISPIYCGNHSDLYSTLHTCIPAQDCPNSKRTKLDESSIDDKASSWKRIPCPIDPTHTIYEHKLEKHLKICPKAKQLSKERSQAYYLENVNKGGSGSLEGYGMDVNTSQNSELTTEFGVCLARRILNAYCKLFLNDSSYTSQSAEQLYDAFPLQDYYSSESKRGLETDLDKCRIKIGGTKHMQQIGSIVGHTRASNLLNDSTKTVLELGAGRGTTGFVVASALSKEKGDNVELVMVERSGSRSNADTIIRRREKEKLEGKHGLVKEKRDYLNESGVRVNRIKCDLAHVNLPSVCALAKDTSSKQTQDILVVAKHLCGAGTDLALKSVASISSQIRGCILATCCHGICSWDEYVGREYLRDIFSNYGNSSFGKIEFDLMKRWACGTVMKRVAHSQSEDSSERENIETKEDGEHAATLPMNYEADKCNISKIIKAGNLPCGPHGFGRVCQRIIDYGRCEYMKKEVFRDEIVPEGNRAVVEMCHYTRDDVTPQNAMLKGLYRHG